MILVRTGTAKLSVMREYIELRVREAYSDLVFRKDEGTILDKRVRLVTLDASDPRMSAICAVHMELRTKGESLFWGWRFFRKYQQREIAAAKVLRLFVTKTIPSGDEYGTVYDESGACPYRFTEVEIEIPQVKSRFDVICGTGARQVSELVLDFRKIAKSVDLASSQAHEVVISAQLAAALETSSISGYKLLPVLDCNAQLARALERPGPKSRVLKQLQITSQSVRVTQNTKFGINPCDPDGVGRYKCPFGHVLGLNILSEVEVIKSDWDGSDIFRTKEFFGYCSPPYRPGPAILITPRMHHFLQVNRVKGHKVEVAHFV